MAFDFVILVWSFTCTVVFGLASIVVYTNQWKYSTVQWNLPLVVTWDQYFWTSYTAALSWLICTGLMQLGLVLVTTI